MAVIEDFLSDFMGVRIQAPVVSKLHLSRLRNQLPSENKAWHCQGKMSCLHFSIFTLVLPMRRISLTIAGLFGICFLAEAQQISDRTRVGIKGGLNLATLSGTINSNPHLFAGFNIAPVVRFSPNAQGFAVQAEWQLSLQGVNEEKQINSQGQTTTVHRRIAYFNLPVLLRQYIGKGAYINLGPQAGILLGASDSGSKDIKKLELGAVAGIGYEFASGVLFDVRLNYGLTDINNNAAERALRSNLNLGGLHNRVIQLTVGKLFGKR